jgi:predicted Zn-dependent protease
VSLSRSCCRWAALTAAVLLGGACAANAYVLLGYHWTHSPVTMQLQLGPASTALSDGSASWGASAEDALATWNSKIGAISFAVVRDSTATKAQGNGINNVFFSSSVYGQAWGSGVLAVTLTYTSSATQTSECDVLFNSNLSWDSYRGSLRYGSTGTVFDFHRVALHEFGHVLGLDHPDQNNQSVVAIMNSTVSNLDALATDDIAGAQSIYGANASAATAPVITTPPASQTVVAGQNVTFAVVASSSTTMSFQWFKNGSALSGATGANLVLSNVTASDTGSYNVVVANSAGSTASSNANLTVTVPTAAPTFTTQPASQSVNVGARITLSAVATGTPTPAYQWYKNNGALSGATSATYTISSVATSDAGSYTVRASNSAGAATSTAAVVTVNVPPTVTTAPVAQSVSAGNTLTLTVAAAGSPSPSYQWQKDGNNIPGATQPTYSVAPTTPTDAGAYTVVITNAAGSITTAPVQVAVTYSQLVNLSTRGYIPPGAALTAGFVLRGSPSKALIVRGIGPTLANFSVANPLADPQLALSPQGSSQIIAANDTWGINPQLATQFPTVGAFSLPLNSTDAATQVQLAPGAYTMRVTGDATTSSGIALAEVYDADSSMRTRLINLSTLGFAASGDNALVAGFAIQGNAPKRLLIRAIGPGLIDFGVTGWMSNPRLDVYATGGTTPITGNDDWSGTSDLSTTFTAAGAFPLATGSRDGACIVSLAPGTYTVVVSGVGGSTGYALVELYDLDP